MWQWIAMGVLVIGAGSFFALWRSERGRRGSVEKLLESEQHRIRELEERIAFMNRKRKEESYVYEKLDKKQKELEEAIDNLPGADRDDLLEFMRDNSARGSDS